MSTPTDLQDGAQGAANPYAEVDRLIEAARGGGLALSATDVATLCADGPVEALERLRGLLKAHGVEMPADEGAARGGTQQQTPPQQRHDPTTDGAYRPGKRERREFFQVSNKFFDWGLKMPPAYRLVWGYLHRHANGRPGRQAKVSTTRLALDCNVHRAAARQAIRYLHHVGAVLVLAEPRRLPDRRWSKTRVYVPPVTALDVDELKAKIAGAPKNLLRMRPDEKRAAATRSTSGTASTTGTDGASGTTSAAVGPQGHESGL